MSDEPCLLEPPSGNNMSSTGTYRLYSVKSTKTGITHIYEDTDLEKGTDDPLLEPANLIRAATSRRKCPPVLDTILGREECSTDVYFQKWTDASTYAKHWADIVEGKLQASNQVESKLFRTDTVLEPLDTLVTIIWREEGWQPDVWTEWKLRKEGNEEVISNEQSYMRKGKYQSELFVI